MTGCSFSDLTDPFTNLLSSDEILFLSSYENVKIVEQDSKITGQNAHPVNISEERVEGALKLLLFRVGNKTDSLFPGKKLEIISYNISREDFLKLTKIKMLFSLWRIGILVYLELN